MLAGCTVVLASAAAGEEDLPGWYVAAGAGGALRSGMEQKGWNRDTVCYPTDACFAADPVPPIAGYRWRYDTDADPGAAVEIALGRRFGRFRAELSATSNDSDLQQKFVGIEYLDGSPRTAGEGPVVADGTASIDDVATRAVSLHLYRDFPGVHRVVTPYLGVGVGRASVEVRGVGFMAEYRDTSGEPRAYDPPLSFYASEQRGDHSDSVTVWHLHAGADYALGGRTQLGAKLTCSFIGETSDTGTYARHPMHAEDPGFTNRNAFDATRSWSLTLTIRRWLGSRP